MKNIKPYNESASKKIQIAKMFNNISTTYDKLNSYMSFGMHHIWRKKAIKEIKNNPKNILDVATGTADFAISNTKFTNANVTGIDISEGMLNIGREKIKKKNLTKRIKLKIADCEKLPFKDKNFDAITVGFGVRNFENILKGLKEMHRVLAKNGSVVILEPNNPKTFPLKQIYYMYFNYIVPFIGKIISKDKSAYKYLPNSVKEFNKTLLSDHLREVGFREIKYIPLSFGIIGLYTAIK